MAKTHGKSSCPVNKNFPKKLVSRQWKEGKKSMFYYTHIAPEAQYAMTNGHCHLQLGVWGAVSPPPPPAGLEQGPGGGLGGEAPGSSEAPEFYRIRKSLKLILYF